jgi:hypothetical protein
MLDEREAPIRLVPVDQEPHAEAAELDRLSLLRAEHVALLDHLAPLVEQGVH